MEHIDDWDEPLTRNGIEYRDEFLGQNFYTKIDGRELAREAEDRKLAPPGTLGALQRDWHNIVGHKTAEWSRPVAIVDDHLIVETDRGKSLSAREMGIALDSLGREDVERVAVRVVERNRETRMDSQSPFDLEKWRADGRAWAAEHPNALKDFIAQMHPGGSEPENALETEAHGIEYRDEFLGQNFYTKIDGRELTQADKFGDFMADSIAHGLPIASGTVRRYLDENAAEIADDVVRFKDGSQIERSDVSLDAPQPKQTLSRGMGR